MIRATAELQFQLSQRNIQSILRQLQGQLNVPLNINTQTAQREIAAVGDTLRRSTGFATNFGLAVGDSARRFAAYGAGVAIIAKIAFAFKSAASELLKFDKDMTTLSQVTGKTKDNLAAISQEILNLSVRTGISASKLSELTVTLSQAGLKGKDLSNALDVIAASDLAPSFENMEESVEGMIAIMQQFKKPSTEFRRQFGFINELSKEFAIESADIIEGVKRAGSVFESAGASLEEFASIMTIVRSTTRESAESIATGLKTITERIQRPEIIDYLEELGVELRDVEGNFIGPLKAFENLSAALSKRGSLNKGSLELIAVAKEIGGGRNLTKIIPILNSAAKAQQILEEASKKAADSLAKDEAAALKSVSKQLDILRAEFVKFVREVSVSDEFKDMAKSALGFAKSMVEVLKATKPFIPLIAQLGVLFGARSIVRGFTGAASPRFSGMRDDIPGMATGGLTGMVSGPGSGTSDDIFARLSNGEFVIKASSVSKVGRNKLEYINSRGEIPAFARGGSVGGEPVSAFGGISSPLISLAVFAALSKAMEGFKEDTESSSGTFDKFKESILPVIPAGILLYQGFKITRTQLDLMAASIRNVNGAVNGFRTFMNDAPRRAYERERTGNLEDAQIANNGAPLTRRQMKLADPITNRVLAAGGTVGEAAVARRAFGRSLNSRVAGEGGNYELAQRRAREAALTARRDDIVRTPARLTATRDTQATNIRNSAAAGAPGFAGFTARQIAAITNNNAAARTGRDRAIGRLQGNISVDNWEAERIQRRVRAYGTPSVRRMTNERDDLVTQRAAATTPGQRGALTRRINRLNTNIADKTTDLDLIRARKAQITATNQSIRSLQQLNATEDALAAANTRRASTNLGDNIAEFDRGMQRPPRSLRRTLRRGAQQFSEANNRFGGAAAGITAAGIAGAAALSSAGIATSRRNADEAIASGSSGTAYSETMSASREERRQSAIMTAGGIGGTIGSIFGPLGTAIGGVTGALLGMTGAVEYITSWFTGIDPEEQDRQQAAEARRASEVNAVNKIINDGVTKYGDQMRVADSVRASDGPEATARKRAYESEARRSLAASAVSAVGRVKSGDATKADALEGYKTLQGQLSNEFAAIGNQVLSTGGTFEDIKKKAPELVAALGMLTQEIGDPNLSAALMEQIQSFNKGSELFKTESILRSVALDELNKAISYQKTVNASLQALASETRSISMSGDSALLRGQAISGDVSSQPIKEFGISLSEISTQLTADFNETLNAVGSFSQELQGQATAYKNILLASEQFSKTLPTILTDNLNPDDIKAAGKRAIRQLYGGLGETKVTDIQKQFEDLVTSQEDSGASADVKSRQIDTFIKSINEQVGGALLDDLEKGRSERQARVAAIADTLEKEAYLRTAALDKQIEASNALDNFTQSFTKSTSDSVAAARRVRTDRILKTIGRSTTGNDVADFGSLTKSRNAKVSEIDRLNSNSKIGIITDEEIKRKTKLVEEVNILGKALAELTNVSEDVTKAQESLAKLEDKQSKLRGKASELAFGGSDSRNSFARSLVAQKFVSAGGNLQSLPEELRSELFSFLQEFGDARVFNGESGTEIINKQTANFLTGLGYSNDQVSTLLTEMQPVEKRQLEALLEIANNTAAAAASAPAAANVPAAAAANRPIGLARGGQARGTDTVPAMLTPGEFIVSRDNARRNRGVLNDINSGIAYASKGGWVGADGKVYTESDSQMVSAYTRASDAYYAAVATNSPDQEKLSRAQIQQREVLRLKGLWNETVNRPVSMTYKMETSEPSGTKERPPSEEQKKLLEDINKQKANNLLRPRTGADEINAARDRMVDGIARDEANIQKAKGDLFFGRKTAGSSLEASTYASQNRALPSGSAFVDRALDRQSNTYSGAVAYANSPDRLTPDEKLDIATKHARYIASGGAAADPTGLGKKFNKDSILLYGMEGGSGPLSPTGGQSGLGNKLGLDRYEQQATGFKPAEMLRIADEKARNPEREYAKQRSRQKELERIAAYRETKEQEKLKSQYDATVEYGKSLFGFSTPATEKEVPAQRPVYKPRVRKPIETDRVIDNPKSKNKNPIIGNVNVMSEKTIQSRLNAFVDPENIKMTKRSLGFDSETEDSDFSSQYLTSVNSLTEKYGKIKKFLFGTGEGKVDENMAQSLFSGARYNNGIFHSAQINQEFLAKNKDKILEIRGIVKDLSMPEDSDLAETAINKASKNAFSKSMKNIMETLDQIREISPAEASLRDASGFVDPAISRRYDQQQAARHAEFMKDAKGSKKSRQSKGRKGPKGSVEPAALTPEQIEELSQQYGAGGAAAAVPSSISMSSIQQQAAVQQAQAQAQVQAVPQALIDEYGIQNRRGSSVGKASLPSVVEGESTGPQAQQVTRPQPSNPELARLGMMDNTFSIDRPSNTGTRPMPTLEQSQQMDRDKFKLELEINRKKELNASNAKIVAEGNAIMAARRIEELKKTAYGRQYVGAYYDGGIVGGMGGRDKNIAQVTSGEGIIQAKSMNKIGASAFNHINKTGELPMKEIQLNVDALMKTPPWMKDFQSSVAALAGTSIKAELAPVSVNVKINGAEVLASIQGQMKDLIKREVMTAVGNMYHDNSGKHLVRGT